MLNRKAARLPNIFSDNNLSVRPSRNPETDTNETRIPGAKATCLSSLSCTHLTSAPVREHEPVRWPNEPICSLAGSALHIHTDRTTWTCSDAPHSVGTHAARPLVTTEDYLRVLAQIKARQRRVKRSAVPLSVRQNRVEALYAGLIGWSKKMLNNC